MTQRARVVDRLVTIFRSDALLRDSGIVTLGAAISKILTLVFFMVVARLLDAAQYGVVRASVAWAMVATSLVTPLAHMFTTYLARHAGDPRARSRYMRNALSLSGLFLVATVLINSLLLHFLNVANPGSWFVVFGLAAFHLYTGLLRGNQSFLKLMAYQSTQSVLQMIVLAAVAAFDRLSAFSVLAVYGSAWILTAALLETLWSEKLEWSITPPSREILKELFGFSIPLIVSYAIQTLLFNGDILFLRAVAGEREAGYYGVAHSLAGMILFIGNSVFSVLLPASSRLPGQEGLEHTKRGVLLVGATCLAAIAGFQVAGNQVVSLLFTARYLASVPSLRVLAVGMSLYSLMNVMSGYWIAHNLSHKYVLVLACTLGSACALNAALTPAYGALGAAGSFTGATSLGFALMLLILWQGARKRSG